MKILMENWRKLVKEITEQDPLNEGSNLQATFAMDFLQKNAPELAAQITKLSKNPEGQYKEVAPGIRFIEIYKGPAVKIFDPKVSGTPMPDLPGPRAALDSADEEGQKYLKDLSAKANQYYQDMFKDRPNVTVHVTM